MLNLKISTNFSKPNRENSGSDEGGDPQVPHIFENIDFQ